jgi:hypothetical protein
MAMHSFAVRFGSKADSGHRSVDARLMPVAAIVAGKTARLPHVVPPPHEHFCRDDC